MTKEQEEYRNEIFTKLYISHRAKIKNYCKKYFRNTPWEIDDVLDDLIQDTFADCHKKYSQF